MKKNNKNITTFEEHLDSKYGKIGTRRRDDFEVKSKAFIIGELIKENRKKAHLTQEQLARKSGTKKSYISRIENGHSDIQIETLVKIVQSGLGKKLRIEVS